MIMKKCGVLFFVFAMLFCPFKTTYCQTTYLSGNANSISVRTIGIGERANDTQENAELQSVKTLLFRGLPDSNQKEPLVSVVENEAIAAHKDYFESLFNQKRFKTFVVSTTQVTDVQKVGKKKFQQTFDVTVNLKALRSDLEQQGIIRKFGL